ncbi:MAG: cyclic nucleotide-binding domain-containing protein [Magnetococcales bacterium]|nr:cyclic nucleotide-binding domain-containing protein [Magnetococcales bacterium]MBF0311320.1 cyclic nucleotide-binding domain-containing protein [Magnetococcales bacterium]
MDIWPLLDKLPFFSTFTDAEKTKLLKMDCYFATFAPGEYLMREGVVDNNALFVLLKGRAQVTKNSNPKTVIATLERGMVVGEISFLTNQARTSNVMATEPMLCFTINNQTMEELTFQLQHKIKDRLILLLVNRLQSKDKELLALMG